MEVEDILNSQLVQRLQSIRDYRCNRGKRYPLWVMLLVTVLGAMSGAQGYRALEDFGKRHYVSLCDYLGVSLKRLPSDTTLRRMFGSMNLAALNGQFNAWAQAQFPPMPGECLAVDGKSLSSTLTGHKESFQDFVAIVSVYSHQQRLVLAQKSYQNKAQSEISVVQNLLETLEMTGVTFTFDALHCQKNNSATG
jgi:DDE_Tnp_1-associated